MTYLPAPSATSSRRMVSQTMKPVSQRMITIQRKHHNMAMPRPLKRACNDCVLVTRLWVMHDRQTIQSTPKGPTKHKDGFNPS